MAAVAAVQKGTLLFVYFASTSQPTLTGLYAYNLALTTTSSSASSPTPTPTSGAGTVVASTKRSVTYQRQTISAGLPSSAQQLVSLQGLSMALVNPSSKSLLTATGLPDLALVFNNGNTATMYRVSSAGSKTTANLNWIATGLVTPGPLKNPTTGATVTTGITGPLNIVSMDGYSSIFAAHQTTTATSLSPQPMVTADIESDSLSNPASSTIWPTLSELSMTIGSGFDVVRLSTDSQPVLSTSHPAFAVVGQCSTASTYMCIDYVNTAGVLSSVQTSIPYDPTACYTYYAPDKLRVTTISSITTFDTLRLQPPITTTFPANLQSTFNSSMIGCSATSNDNEIVAILDGGAAGPRLQILNVAEGLWNEPVYTSALVFDNSTMGATKPSPNASTPTIPLASGAAITSSSGLSKTTIIIIAAASGGVVLLLAIILCVICVRRRRNRKRSTYGSRSVGGDGVELEKLNVMSRGMNGEDSNRTSATLHTMGSPPPGGYITLTPVSPLVIPGGLSLMSLTPQPRHASPLGREETVNLGRGNGTKGGRFLGDKSELLDLDDGGSGYYSMDTAHPVIATTTATSATSVAPYVIMAPVTASALEEHNRYQQQQAASAAGSTSTINNSHNPFNHPSVSSIPLGGGSSGNRGYSHSNADTVSLAVPRNMPDSIYSPGSSTIMSSHWASQLQSHHSSYPVPGGRASTMPTLNHNANNANRAGNATSDIAPLRAHIGQQLRSATMGPPANSQQHGNNNPVHQQEQTVNNLISTFKASERHSPSNPSTPTSQKQRSIPGTDKQEFDEDTMAAVLADQQRQHTISPSPASPVPTNTKPTPPTSAATETMECLSPSPVQEPLISLYDGKDQPRGTLRSDHRRDSDNETLHTVAMTPGLAFAQLILQDAQNQAPPPPVPDIGSSRYSYQQSQSQNQQQPRRYPEPAVSVSAASASKAKASSAAAGASVTKASATKASAAGAQGTGGKNKKKTRK